MQCLHCRKNIPWRSPFHRRGRNLCMYCRTDTRLSRHAHVLLMVGLTLGTFGACWGYSLSGVWWGGLIGFFAGFVPIAKPVENLKKRAADLEPVRCVEPETQRECLYCQEPVNRQDFRCNECGAPTARVWEMG